MTRRFAPLPANNRPQCRLHYVADASKGGLNVTAELIRKLLDPDHRGAVFTDLFTANLLAYAAEKKEPAT